MSGPSPVRSVTVTIIGTEHHGTYLVEGPMVHVRSPLGAKAVRLEGPSPEIVAKLLLLELVLGGR